MNVHYAPPEFCCIKSEGRTAYPMHPSADVWSFGLVLADIAGLSRPHVTIRMGGGLATLQPWMMESTKSRYGNLHNRCWFILLCSSLSKQCLVYDNGMRDSSSCMQQSIAAASLMLCTLDLPVQLALFMDHARV